MKKAMILVMCIVSLCMVFYSNEKNVSITDLTLSSIEALAIIEEDLPGVTITCSRSAYDGIGRCYYNKSYPWSPICEFNGYQYDYCSYTQIVSL